MPYRLAVRHPARHVVRRVAGADDDREPFFDAAAPLPSDRLPLPLLLARYPTPEALRQITNRQLGPTPPPGDTVDARPRDLEGTVQLTLR